MFGVLFGEGACLRPASISFEAGGSVTGVANLSWEFHRAAYTRSMRGFSACVGG